MVSPCFNSSCNSATRICNEFVAYATKRLFIFGYNNPDDDPTAVRDMGGADARPPLLLVMALPTTT